MTLRFLALFTLVLCGLVPTFTSTVARAQTYTSNPPLKTLSPVKVDDPLLARLLGFGEIEVLDDLPSYEEEGDQPLALRLVSMPGDNDACVPDTDVPICNSLYYLVVISESRAPQASVFVMGEIGEIADVRWLSPPDEQHVRIRFEARRYPADVLEENPALQSEQEVKRYTAIAGPTSLQVLEE
ncbi:MAG TPA: hypothetical protein VFG50_05850 [Rhodothermales bacterium]|nr:hypothetical protein [Rhodothermales bacterium]